MAGKSSADELMQCFPLFHTIGPMLYAGDGKFIKVSAYQNDQNRTRLHEVIMKQQFFCLTVHNFYWITPLSGTLGDLLQTIVNVIAPEIEHISSTNKRRLYTGCLLSGARRQWEGIHCMLILQSIEFKCNRVLQIWIRKFSVCLAYPCRNFGSTLIILWTVSGLWEWYYDTNDIMIPITNWQVHSISRSQAVAYTQHVVIISQAL